MNKKKSKEPAIKTNKIGRRTDETVYAHLYDRFTPAHNGFYYECFYCGDPADTVDHVPPLSRVNDYRSLYLNREIYITVPCCRECNGILGNTLQDSIVMRVEYLKDRLTNKYKRLVNAPEWDEDDIEKFGYHLKTTIRASERARKRARRRVDYYDGLNAFMIDYELGMSDPMENENDE